MSSNGEQTLPQVNSETTELPYENQEDDVKEKKDDKELPAFFEPIDLILEKYKDSMSEMQSKIKLEWDQTLDLELTLYRFLKGYEFNIDDAAAACDAMLKWRIENKLPEIHKKLVSMPDMTKQEEYPHAKDFRSCHAHTFFHGYDVNDQSCSVTRVGHTDPRKITKFPLENFLLYQTYHIEAKWILANRKSREKGVVLRTAKLLDCEGLGAIHLYNAQGMLYMRHFLKMSQDYYPELLANMIIINAPWIFTFISAAVKPFMNEETLGKMRVLGDDYKDILLEMWGADTIPDFLGGNCECKDSIYGSCCPLLDSDGAKTKVTVGRRSKYEDTQYVEPESGKKSTIIWQFQTKDRDIGFSATFVPDNVEDEVTEIVPYERVQSHLKEIGGKYETSVSGTAKLVWDNSFSMMYGKTLTYSTAVMKDEVSADVRYSTTTTATTTTPITTTTTTTTATN